MPTDATGTPTSLGIPKFNTSVDAPSGLGFNATMDEIDALIAARITKPATPATDDALVWDGSGWVADKLTNAHIDAAAAIAASKLADYPSDVTKALLGDGTWGTVGGSTVYRKLTSKTVGNTTTETDLLNGEITLAAGVLSTNKTARVTLEGDYLANTGANPTLTLRVKLGTTTVFADTTSGHPNSAARQPWKIVFNITNLSSVSVQEIDGLWFWLNGTTTPATGQGDLGSGGAAQSFRGTAAENSADALAVVVTVQLGVASANFEYILKRALVEVI